MRKKNLQLIETIALLLVLSSCLTQKNLSYLQFAGQTDNSIIPLRDQEELVTPNTYKLMPYDNLFIRVITPDPQWSEIFNTVPTASVTAESAALLGYLVDNNGYIDLPFAGKLKVSGKTLNEVKIELDSVFKNYVKDAAITVRLINNYISILGDVNAPGRYPITKDQINIFEALSMSGDISFYGKRSKLQLIRQTSSGPVIHQFSLSDQSILNSEYYYVMPNDIIYAEPLKARSFQLNSTVYSLIMSSAAMILTSITTLFIIFGYNPYGTP